MTRRKAARPACEHEPILMAMPGHPDWVAVECPRCGATTGYGLDPDEAWSHWRVGDVAVPRDLMGVES